MSQTRIVPAVLSLLCAAFVCSTPYLAFAAASADFTVTPVLFDEKGKARDIIKESFKISNTSDHKINLYPSVNNVHPADGQQQFATAYNADDLSASLANWIELSRGVIELGPGEEKEIPFIIRVSLNAVPGDYHANISFGQGNARALDDGGTAVGVIAINLEVQADVREILQLNKFTSDNMVFTGDDVLFKYQLQNIGNQELQPTGEIRIYDRKGTEVASVDVNKEGKLVTPDQTAQLASVWSAINGFGKFKALLTVNYGKGQTASVQDTVYFWIIPWKQLLMLFAGALTAVVILVFYFRRWFEERHLGKLAHAGLLKVEALAHIHHESPEETPIATLVEKKKGIFSFFKRRHRKSGESDAVVAPGVPTPRETKVSIPAPRGLRDAFDRSTVTVSEGRGLGGTIDLKQLHVMRKSAATNPTFESDPPKSPHVEIQGSVINLRKRQ